MRETFELPEGDRCMTISEHDEVDFGYGPIYLGIARTDDLVIIQLTVNNARTIEQKKALFSGSRLTGIAKRSSSAFDPLGQTKGSVFSQPEHALGGSRNDWPRIRGSDRRMSWSI